MAKGQSFVVTHALFVGFSVVFVLVIVVTLNALKDDYQEFIAKNEMQEVCFSVRSGIEKIYLVSSYSPATNTTLGRIRLALPEKIAGLGYRINFSGSSALINAQKFNDSCVVGFSNAIGYTTGGDTDLLVRAYSNASKTIEVIKV